jgi:hypothetical protein
MLPHAFWDWLDKSIIDTGSLALAVIAVPWLACVQVWLARRSARLLRHVSLLCIAMAFGPLVFSLSATNRVTRLGLRDVLVAVMFLAPLTALVVVSRRVACDIEVRGLEPEPPICDKCGYDLTGLTEPRCPECGTPFLYENALPQ